MCEYPTFYHEKLVTARKQHKCCETGKLIAKGERYWRLTGLWDGKVQTFRQSEAAYHFSRFINGVGDGLNAGKMTGYDPEACIGFGGIGNELPSDYQDEWEKVCKGQVTRNTVGEWS